MSQIISNAIFSSDRIYRYVLWRIWDDSLPAIMFIGLNPSTADEKSDDPTMRRCAGFARAWGYGGFYMTNLFAFRATMPSELKKFAKPIGSENDQWILQTASKVEKVVFAWGVNGSFMDRDKAVLSLFPNGYCIDISQGGFPKHPLYLSAMLPLKRFK